jgi:hypothetical protein
MARTIAISALVLAIACGPGVATDDAGATSGADATDDGTLPMTSSGVVDESTSGAGSADTSGGSSSESSSTGEPFTFSADETLVELSCGELGAQLLIEIYPGTLDGECVPAADFEGPFAMIVIEPWNGMAGTLKIQGEGPARGVFGGDPDSAFGHITIRVSAEWTVESATLELVTNANTLEGTADLSECGPDDPHDPCA